MSADHPSQNTRPCWCNTDKTKYGCYPCADVPTPLEPGEIADCMYCTYGTRNVNPPACDPCVQRLEHAAAELDIPEIRCLLNQLHLNTFDPSDWAHWYGEMA